MAFSLFDLGQALNAGAGAINNFRQQRTLADLGQKLQSGDYESAAKTALSAGEVGTGLELLKLGNQRKSDAEVSQILGGLGLTGGVSAPAPAAQPQMAAPGVAPVAGGDIPRGLRNMNPGNIEAGGFAQSQPGYVGSDGRYARFDTLDHGVGAQAALLERYGQKGINTISGVINRWAPQAENGAATGNYIKSVASKIGIEPNAPIDLSNPETRTRLAYAMGEFENGRPIGSGQTGQNVQVADASGAVPQSAGGGNADALQQRLNTLSGLLAKPNISASARAAIQAQIENTRNMISRSDRQENLGIQRENLAENRKMRQTQFEAAQQERELRRQERADKLQSEATARNEKITESQGKSGVYYTEGKASDHLLSDPNVMVGGIGMQGAIGRSIAAIPSVGQNLAPETTRSFNQAADNFVSNVVYAKSGASATAAEYDRAFRQYIPTPTDGPTQIEQKAAARALWLKQMKVSAGPSVKESVDTTTPKATGGATPLPAGWSVQVH